MKAKRLIPLALAMIAFLLAGCSSTRTDNGVIIENRRSLSNPIFN
jgi:hypothetical protein